MGDKLAGIVRANAVKNAQGRSQLAAIMKANKMELKAAVQGAVHKGEVRMMKAEQKLKDMNKKTKASMNMRITSEVSKLAKESASQIENLRLSSSKARAEMRRELLYAVRAAIARSIAASKKAAQRQLKDAVGTMNRSLLALKTETAKKIKKTNHRVTAYADQLRREAQAVDKAMKANTAALSNKIRRNRRNLKNAARRAALKSAQRWNSAMRQVASSVGAAQRRASAKFGKLYMNMAKNRARADAALARSVKVINDRIAKQAALADSRFSKTVKNINAARAEAARQVLAARKTFATSIVRTIASVKDQESRLSGEIAVVSGEVARDKAVQMRVNRRTQAELKRIRKLSNKHHSAS